MAQPTYGREDVLMEQFRAIAQRYEINDYFAGKLKQLEGSAAQSPDGGGSNGHGRLACSAGTAWLADCSLIGLNELRLMLFCL